MTQDNSPELALQWHRDGLGAELATALETWGSAPPRAAGSQMGVDGAGRMAGSVSGDCVEAAVDGRTAVVTLTHDPKLDDPALAFALRSQAFHVGCPGSKRTHAARGERLAARGFTAGEMARLHAPVGLDIGARTPGKIALSVMAEITQV